MTLPSLDAPAVRAEIPKDEFAAIRAGDEQAFERVYREHYEGLCRFVWRYMRSRETAEDIVQQVLTEVWCAREWHPPVLSMKRYLYSAVRIRCYDTDCVGLRRARTVRFDAHVHDRATTPVQAAVEREEISTWIERAVRHLTPKTKRIFELLAATDCSRALAAEALGTSEKNIEVQYRRARIALRAKLEPLRP